MTIFTSLIYFFVYFATQSSDPFHTDGYANANNALRFGSRHCTKIPLWCDCCFVRTGISHKSFREHSLFFFQRAWCISTVAEVMCYAWLFLLSARYQRLVLFHMKQAKGNRCDIFKHAFGGLGLFVKKALQEVTYSYQWCHVRGFDFAVFGDGT